MHLGLLGRLPRAVLSSQPRKEVNFASSTSSSSGLVPKRRSRTATRSKSSDRHSLVSRPPRIRDQTSSSSSSSSTTAIMLDEPLDVSYDFPNPSTNDYSTSIDPGVESTRQSRSREVRP